MRVFLIISHWIRVRTKVIKKWRFLTKPIAVSCSCHECGYCVLWWDLHFQNVEWKIFVVHTIEQFSVVMPAIFLCLFLEGSFLCLLSFVLDSSCWLCVFFLFTSFFFRPKRVSYSLGSQLHKLTVSESYCPFFFLLLAYKDESHKTCQVKLFSSKSK